MSLEILNNSEKILIVDDDPSTALIVQEALKQNGYVVHTAENGVQALQQLEEWRPSLVLLDINMPGLDGHETLTKIREKKDYISTVFVSGNSELKDIVHGLDLGADDYICKPFNVIELMARVRAQLRIKQLKEDLEIANDKLKELVNIDDLTGLFNMRSLYERLDRELARGYRFKRSSAVVMMDMDYFKSVNDTNDHLFGSFVLSEVGAIIKKTMRQIDFAARYGGDEFLIVLSEVDLSGALAFCERLRQSIEGHLFKNEDSSMHLTCSLGIALTDPYQKIISRELVKVADRALYEAKESGRNRVCFYSLADKNKIFKKVE